MTILVSSLACLAGCSSSSQTESPPPHSAVTYQQRFVEQMEARQDFIADTENRIDAIEDRIAQLNSKIRPGASAFSATEQSQWRQELADLEREKESARARVEEGRTADTNEWRIWRSDIAVQVERLESNVETLATRVETRASENAAVIPDDERQPVGGQDDDITEHELHDETPEP